MEIKIDASNPPRVGIYLGAEEALDVVKFSVEYRFSLECEVNQLPVFKMRQVAMEDGKPVFVKGEGFKYVDTEFAFEKISFVGDWSRLARALSDEQNT